MKSLKNGLGDKFYVLCILKLKIFYFFKDLIYLYLDRERNINVCLLLEHPPSGAWPVTQAYALTGNRTGNSGSQVSDQSTEPGQKMFFKLLRFHHDLRNTSVILI